MNYRKLQTLAQDGLIYREQVKTSERELSRAQRNSQSLCVLVLDIDHFKRYNDTRGHDAGDALLAEFAKLLSRQTRKEDVTCRYGGEEFVIVLPTTNVENAVKHANSICEATRLMRVKVDKEDFGSVTVSIGVSVFSEHGQNLAELINKADTALYFAKHNGRDQVKVFDQSLS